MEAADFIKFTIGKQKRIALIAHDGKKQELVSWCERNKEILPCNRSEHRSAPCGRRGI